MRDEGPQQPPTERRFRADRGDHRRRLDLVVVRHLADLPLSRSLAARLIAGGKVVVAGRLARRPAERLDLGDTVEVRDLPPPEPREVFEPESMEVSTVWEDEHLLVVDKPAGLVVHPTGRRRTGTLVNGLLGLARGWSDPAQHPRPAHRLDQHTSGLLLVAKTAEARSGLGRAFERRQIEKDYLAVTDGIPGAQQGRIETPIGREPGHARRRQVGGVDPLAAATRWQTIGVSSRADCALLCCSPESGRTHQIRVHLASIGLPLIGDPLYWNTPSPPLPAAAAGFPRQALHAWRLGLRHPVTDRELCFVAPPPADLLELLIALAIELSDTPPDGGFRSIGGLSD